MASTARADPSTTEPFPPLEPAPPSPLGAGPTSVDSGVDTPLSKTQSNRAPPSSASLAPSKLDKTRLSPSRSPLTLTGAAAMAELKRKKTQIDTEQSRQTSSNPALEAKQTLLGNGGISRPQDAPTPDKLSEPMRHVVERINVPDNMSSSSTQPSPNSVTSFATASDNTTAVPGLTITANHASTSGQQFVAEPAQMNEAPYTNDSSHLAPSGQDGEGPKAYSYPGPPPDQNQDGGPARGMSLPGYGQSSPKSPASSKRHKCPYCATDFTRHHNLKSHLLTHSHEKPYVCQTCNSRFRRLHDLKRHTKLHTGERPHTCDKCGRRFARGDALARHNKGPGGCAGRRSSFGGDDDYDGGDGMDGVEYGDDEDGVDQHGRRVSEPSRKRAHVESPQDSNLHVYRQHSSTYPPVPNRAMSGNAGSMGPPQVVHPGPNNVASPRDASIQGNATAAHTTNNVYYSAAPASTQSQVYTQMTESPRPLSPGHPPDQHRLSVPDAQNPTTNRNRSPSLTTQFQQAHFGRASGGRGTPPFPSTHPPAQGAPQLPVLPGMVSTSQPQQGRSALQPSAVPAGPGPSLLQHGQIPPTSAHGGGSGQNSLSSHGQSSGGSIRDALGHEQSDIWGYVRSLEQRFSRMQDEYELRISRLQEEVISLRGQMSNAASYSSEMAQSRY